MKILSCCPRGYYANPESSSYEFDSFVTCFRRMGHTVHHFDHMQLATQGRDEMNDFFLSVVKGGGYDLVWIQTHKDEFLPEVLDEARAATPVIGFNCDDDWRWEDYSSKWARHFSWAVTTYRHIYDTNREAFPNLRLTQWGCSGLYDGAGAEKDIGISFVGKAYGDRVAQIDHLRRTVGLDAYGHKVRPPKTPRLRMQKFAARLTGIPWKVPDRVLPDQAAVNGIWNRSRISFTPLDASRAGFVQIKARVFDMGLSGTLMLCTRAPQLEEFYTPGTEYVDYESMDECTGKARHYLTNESERRRIAEAYRRRTEGEHLWRHRYRKLFAELGLETP